MKLDYFKVKGFKNLVDFEFDFDEKSAGFVTVLLGRNGSGKSNLIEALVIIFRNLFLGENTKFPYELRYTLEQGRIHVCIKNDSEGAEAKDRFSFIATDTATGKDHHVSRSALRGSEARRWLPQFVFAYYSGPSRRLEEHFADIQRLFYRELLAGHEQAFRPLFYARPVHSQFVLLSFFTSEDKKPRAFLEKLLGIVDLDSVLFILREPPWSDRDGKHVKGDPRFWGARGVVADFLDKIYDRSLAPMRLPWTLDDPSGIAKPRKEELLFLYLRDLATLRDLAAESGTARAFFKQLESTYISDLIHEVRIRVKVKNVDGSLTFRELSEGEQQLLTVVGLLRFTKESESLFLLDEPDTHLNPAWGMEYLSILKDVAEPGTDSQVIVATHDPLVLAGLKRNEVVVMERNEISGKVEAFRPDIDPQGLGVVGILRSAMFGLRSVLDAPTQRRLDRRFDLVAKAKKTEAEKNELRQLSEELASAGFAHEYRDANFDRYAKAIGRVRHADKTTLTRSEVKELEEEAEAAVKQLIAEEAS